MESRVSLFCDRKIPKRAGSEFSRGVEAVFGDMTGVG
jgi:hypothetical protein